MNHAARKVKSKLAQGELLSMVLIDLLCCASVDRVAELGFDIAFIDCEKGPATTEHLDQLCRAARLAGIATLVRPWMFEPGLVSRYLDLGCDGIMLAAVDEPPQAAAFVEAVRYARFRDHEDKILVAMIESPQALGRIDALAAVPGLDAWFIGPNDLAHRMGYPGQAHLPVVRQAVVDGLQAIRAAGHRGGTLAVPGQIESLAQAGARILMTRMTDLLRPGAEQFLQVLSSARAA